MHTRIMDQVDKWGGHTWSSMIHGFIFNHVSEWIAENDPK